MSENQNLKEENARLVGHHNLNQRIKMFETVKLQNDQLAIRVRALEDLARKKGAKEAEMVFSVCILFDSSACYRTNLLFVFFFFSLSLSRTKFFKTSPAMLSTTNRTRLTSIS